MAIIDDEMQGMGFVRIGSSPAEVPNADKTIYRMVARYRATVSKEQDNIQEVKTWRLETYGITLKAMETKLYDIAKDFPDQAVRLEMLGNTTLSDAAGRVYIAGIKDQAGRVSHANYSAWICGCKRSRPKRTLRLSPLVKVAVSSS